MQTNSGFWVGKNRLQSLPKRIVSLVPSQTELLYDLGLENEVVGITLFCVHPKSWFEKKQRVGGTKNINLETIHNLKPDFILANKEENLKDQIEELATFYPVFVTEISDYASALQLIIEVGNIVEKKERAKQLQHNIEQEFQQLETFEQVSACYLIWNEPKMTVGADTFIHQMLLKAGFQNCFADATRYPEVTNKMIAERQPDYILLSSEPFPFKERHKSKIQQEFPNSQVLIVNGELFSWYGSRMLLAPNYFSAIRKNSISVNSVD